jgi:hypothetical protein
MEKENYIKELIKTAQESIWKNELAKEFTEKFGGKDKDVKIKATEHAIAKDEEYIAFLRDHLPPNNVSGT